jgi:hypothetical protein
MDTVFLSNLGESTSFIKTHALVLIVGRQPAHMYSIIPRVRRILFGNG